MRWLVDPIMTEEMDKIVMSLPAGSPLEVGRRLRSERAAIISRLVEAACPGNELADVWEDRDSPAERELRDVEFSTREALIQRLLVLDEALARMYAGTFGLCADCGEPIDARRIESDPAATLCLKCKAALEPAPAMATL